MTETAARETHAANSSRPACYLILYNVSKRHNVGTLARSASAFGVKQVCLVGSRQFNAFGSHGSVDHVNFGHYALLEACVSSLKDQRGCRIVGIEITDDAQPVHSHPFSGPTAFMIGNEGTGLSQKQMSLCDSFVYIPQYGQGTASLNVTVATSIVLQHFAVWADYLENQREQHKFHVGEKPQRTHSRGVVGRSPTEEEQERLRRQQRREEGSLHDEPGRSNGAASSGSDVDDGTLALFD